MLNGMKYVGKTTRAIEERFNEHTKAKTHLGNSIRFHGAENFLLEIIEECETQEQLNEREIFWIAELNTKHPYGYNFTDGGEGSKGFTEETLEKIRSRKYSPESLALMSIVQKKRAGISEGKANLKKAREIRLEKEKARPPEERGCIKKFRKSVYPVLETELIKRKISHTVLAKIFGITPWSISKKYEVK